YGRLGHGERVAMFEFEDKHGFSQPRREAAMRWLRRWLVGIDDAPVEKMSKVFTDAELQCTRTGQVLSDLRGKSAFALNLERANTLAKARARFADRKPDEVRVLVRKLIGLPGKLPPRDDERLLNELFPDQPEKTNGIVYSETWFETEPGIQL